MTPIDYSDERFRAVCLTIQAVKLGPGRETVEMVDPETYQKVLECYRYAPEARLFIAVGDVLAEFRQGKV